MSPLPASAHPGATGFRALLAAAALLAAGLPTPAASPPDWAAPLLGQALPPGLNPSAVVVLYEEGTVRFLPDNRQQKTVRRVYRILSKDSPTLNHDGCSYNADTDRILRAQAWIVSPDGKKTKVLTRSDFTDQVAKPDSDNWGSGRYIYFAVGDRAEVGGHVIWEVETEEATGLWDASWYFFRHWPIVRSVFEASPVPGQQLAFKASSPTIPTPVPGRSPGSLRWEMRLLSSPPRDLPGGFVPNLRIVTARSLAPDALGSRMQTWGQFSALAKGIVAPRLVAAPAVAAQARTLVDGRAGRWERIRALTEFVQTEVDYLAITLDQDSLAGYRPHLPEEVLRTRLGDCKDKSALLVTLLRELGEQAQPVLVQAGYPSLGFENWPSAQFNHMVVGIPADDQVPAHWPVVDGGPLGRLVIFDPTDSDAPLGVLSLMDQGSAALILADSGQKLLTLPPDDPTLCPLTRRVTGTVSPAGGLQAAVEELRLGSRASGLHEDRKHLGDERFRQETLEKGFLSGLARLSGLTWTETWAPAEARSRLAYQFQAAQAMRRAGADTLLVAPGFISVNSADEPWKAACEGGVWLNSRGLDEEVRLELPEGFAGKLPAAWSLEAPLVRAALTYRIEGQTLIFTRRYFRQAGLLSQADYAAYQAFTQKLAEAVRRPVIVRRAQAAAAP